ncbi:MAG: T9SS type A sorting domain-containing protein [Bacteroidales bacterium]|nr:T9SS type A sorting domain-containing protein [Bacteroidales bacterium]
MKNIIFISLIYLILPYSLYSQSCHVWDLNSQQEIDNFQDDHPGCTAIDGDLVIEGSDITNLDSLIVITSIEGQLWIKHNPELVSLSGLDSISFIGEDLRIYDNDSIVNLSGLGNLVFVGDRIMISDNASLTSFSGMDKLTETQGLLIISTNDALVDLNGLENLQRIGGHLKISFNVGLSSLEGLENVDTVGGSLGILYNSSLLTLSGLNGLIAVFGLTQILGNDSLQSLTGLENLNYIGEEFSIESNPKITDLTGLSSLNFVGSTFYIDDNNSLSSLSGMGNFDSINGNLMISQNNALTSLNGLENVVSLSSLVVFNNLSLNSLSGIENIIPNSINGLYLHDNPLLENCEVLSICEFLASPTGAVGIYNNAPGCNSPPEIAHQCGFTMPCLPFGHYYLQNQQVIDSFQFDYPDCHQLAGNVIISGDDISNLNGLTAVHSIGGGLQITDNPVLTSLSGLDNLESVNNTLYLRFNEVLNDLQGLNSLTSLGGYDLWIEGNNNLRNLSGIDSIDAQTIDFLLIYSNPLLSVCDVSSICDFLSIPEASSQIGYNMTGCNSTNQVEAECGLVGLDEESRTPEFFYPNPASNEIRVSGDSLARIKTIRLFNQLGQEMIHQSFDGQAIDVSNLPSGIYFLELSGPDILYRSKLLIK